jgi:hypothetical protein
MELKRVTMISLLLASTWSAVVPSIYGQDCYPSKVIDTVADFLKLPASGRFQLRVTELPKIKEEFIGLQQERLETDTVRIVDFYEVSPATYQVVSHKIVSITVQLDNDSVWVVGVGPNNTTYQLVGFADPTATFNKLMADAGIRVNDAETALDTLWLFLKLAHGHEFQASILGDSMQLQAVALKDFRLRLPASQRLATFNNWWKRVPLRLRNEIAAPKVQSREDQFEVAYYRYSEGSIKLETALINRDGSVSQGASKTIYK